MIRNIPVKIVPKAGSEPAGKAAGMIAEWAVDRGSAAPRSRIAPIFPQQGNLLETIGQSEVAAQETLDGQLADSAQPVDDCVSHASWPIDANQARHRLGSGSQ